jgi:hypothetical protein
VIGAQIGDTVYVTKTNGRDRSVGLIRYIGPVDGLDEDSFWFGIELLVSLLLHLSYTVCV